MDTISKEVMDYWRRFFSKNTMMLLVFLFGAIDFHDKISFIMKFIKRIPSSVILNMPTTHIIYFGYEGLECVIREIHDDK